MGQRTELIRGTADGLEKVWRQRVREAGGGKCSNCGSTTRVSVRMVVPKKAGGLFVPSNGILLCRTCELAREIGSRSTAPVSGERTRPVNFFVGKELHARLKNGMATRYGFRSVSSLVRHLISGYVRDPDMFDDVGLYQSGGSDVKVNVWVDRDMYEHFKAIVDREGRTVTDTLKGLICMYEAEAERIVGRNRT